MKHLWVILIVIFGSLTSYSARAELEPLPEVQNLSINDFVAQSQLVTKNFEDDPLLGFQIQIPNGFNVRPDDNLKNIVKNNTLFGEIFYAIGPSMQGGRPYILVESIELDRLISATNWIKKRALNWGYTLRAIESNDELGNSYEAFYIRLDDFGSTEIVRARGLRHQNRLILVEYVMPVAAWDELRDQQIFTIKSFEFLEDYTVTPPEAMLNYNFADNFFMQYPKSWIFSKQNRDSSNRLNIDLRTSDENGFIMAEAGIIMVSERSLVDRGDQMIYPLDLPEIIRQKINTINEAGYNTDPLLEQKSLPITFQNAFNTTEVYPLRRKADSIYVTEAENPITKELWLTVIRRPKEEGISYVVTMIAPSRDIRFAEWAFATRGYEEIIKSIR